MMRVICLCWGYLFVVTNGRSVKPFKACDGIIINDVNHEKEVLRSAVEAPYQLAIDYDTNNLFFSYTANNGIDIFKSAYFNLKTNEYNEIPGISGGFANTVDKQSQIVYLGGGDGIYKFNYETKAAKKLQITTKSIWQLSHNKDLYFTTYPDEKLYKYSNNIVEVVPELQHTTVLLAAVDNDNNILFSNTSGLFAYNKATESIESIGAYNVNGMTNDINGEIYFSTPAGIYYVTKNMTVKEIAKISNVFGVAVEGDGSIIYADRSAVIRLHPSKEKCYVENSKDLESK